jgi:hypothetical protein
MQPLVYNQIRLSTKKAKSIFIIKNSELKNKKVRRQIFGSQHSWRVAENAQLYGEIK